MPSLTSDTLEAIARGVPAPRAERLRAAFSVFEATPMPSSSDESWRYVDLDFDLAELALPDQPGAPLPTGEGEDALGEVAGRAVLVDGVLAEVEASDGIVAQSLVDAWAEGWEPDLLPSDIDKFAAARAAFGVDGVVIRTPRRTALPHPLLVEVQATQPDVISFPTVAVELDEDSEAAVVIAYRSPHGVLTAMSPGVAVKVGDGARLRLASLQLLGDAARCIVHQRVRLGRDSTGRIGEVGLGARLSRLDLGVSLAGAGASTEVVGLYFGERDQVLDYRMVIDHVGPNTSSDVFLKGAVEDEARSVFTGLLKIQKDAVRSSAFETNRNLVLSEGAKAHSVPNLEILCNDVVCGHGSSVGPLEEDQLYYLQSRGLSRPRAERVLVRGFFQEVIERLPVPNLAQPIQEAVNRRFVTAQQEGRV